MTEQQLEVLIRTVTREVMLALSRAGLTVSGLDLPPAGGQAAPAAAGGQGPQLPATEAACGGGQCGCKPPPWERRWQGRLLSEASLEDLPPGGRLIVAPRTLVTPLARDTARQRGIELVEGAFADQAAEGPRRGFGFFTDRPGPAADTLIGSLRQCGLDVRDCSIGSHRTAELETAAADCARQVAAGAIDQAVIIFEPAFPLWRRLRNIPGLRPVLARDRQTAVDSRRDLNSNVLIIPGRQMGLSQLRKTITAWIGAGNGQA
jgi:ribose 5-phosphate isomerase RpiB